MPAHTWLGEILGFDMSVSGWLTELFESQWAVSQLHALQNYFFSHASMFIGHFPMFVIPPDCGKLAWRCLRGEGLETKASAKKSSAPETNATASRMLLGAAAGKPHHCRAKRGHRVDHACVAAEPSPRCLDSPIELAQFHALESSMQPHHSPALPDVTEDTREDLSREIARLCVAGRKASSMATCAWDLKSLGKHLRCCDVFHCNFSYT